MLILSFKVDVEFLQLHHYACFIAVLVYSSVALVDYKTLRLLVVSTVLVMNFSCKL